MVVASTQSIGPIRAGKNMNSAGSSRPSHSQARSTGASACLPHTTFCTILPGYKDGIAYVAMLCTARPPEPVQPAAEALVSRLSTFSWVCDGVHYRLDGEP
ncbi:hypothetical protein VTI28DRAFT_8686 [Corynascus sepedonium]